MGNRAVIALDSADDKAIGIYVHWNGGRDSIDGFLMAAKEIMKGRLDDGQYSAARLVQCITTFFPGNSSVGLDHLENLDCDNYDNGVYVIDTATLEVKVRLFYHKGEEQSSHDSQALAAGIVEAITAGANVVHGGE